MFGAILTFDAVHAGLQSHDYIIILKKSRRKNQLDDYEAKE